MIFDNLEFDGVEIDPEIVEIGKRIYRNGFVAANDGNISARIDEQRIVITPTGVSKGFMDLDMMVISDMNGTQLSSGPKASSEIQMHLAVYHARPEIQAILRDGIELGEGDIVELDVEA